MREICNCMKMNATGPQGFNLQKAFVIFKTNEIETK